jgi:hypothetical protein
MMAAKVREVITANFAECQMAGDDSKKLVVVLKKFTDNIAGSICTGAAKLDGQWYRVTGIGDDWQLNWAHRQHSHEVIDNPRLIAALERAVEKGITDMPSLQSLAARNRVPQHA